MSSTPAFQFYVQDFLTGTTLLSAAATGAYIRMLSVSWELGPIPDNPAALSRSMGLSQTDPPFETVWLELKDKWHLTLKGWINPRLELVRWEQLQYRQGRAEDGRRGADKRWGKNRVPYSLPYDDPTKNDRVSMALRSPISDLQKDHDLAKNEDPALVKIGDQPRSSSSRARANVDGDWVEPHPNPHGKPTNLINGVSQRRHGSHAWCSPERPNLCVPLDLHAEIIGASAKPEADVKAWYVATVAKYDGQPIGDDRFTFWRNELAQWIGTVTAPPAKKRAGSTSGPSLKELRHRYEERTRANAKPS